MLSLFHHPFCPHSRFIRLAAAEHGVEMRLVEERPWARRQEFLLMNPAGTTPVLVTDGSPAIPGASVICEFLDSRKGGKLFPKDATRWSVLSRMALCDGILDAAILRRYEFLRPEALRSTEWDQRQKTKVDQALGALEKEVSGFGDRADIDTLTAAIALDYLDFRFLHEAWREKHPNLANWHKVVSARPSLNTTMPTD